MTKKTLTITLVIIMLFTMLFAVACRNKNEVDNITKILDYASKQTKLSLTLEQDGELIYSYADSKTEDKYGLGIKAEDYLGTKGESGLLLKKENFKEGYIFLLDDKTKEAQFTATLADAKSLLSIDASEVKVSIKANFDTNTVSEYTLSYTSKNGFDVVISLA